MKHPRLARLLDELEVDAVSEDDIDPAAPIRGADAFFTARVLDALPSRLAFTGLTPLQRAGLLAAFHGLAVVAGFFALSAFAPDSVASLAEQAHGWLEHGARSPSLWMLAGGTVIGVLALAVGRSPASTA